VVDGGLGGFVTFYLALAHGLMKIIVCEDSPGILTEEKFQEAIMQGKGVKSCWKWGIVTTIVASY